MCDVSMVVYYICMDRVVREVNVRVLGTGLELVSVNGGRLEINQMLYANDTSLDGGLGEVV